MERRIAYRDFESGRSITISLTSGARGAKEERFEVWPSAVLFILS